MIKVAINGFGRIGRITTRALLKNKNIEVVAINDLSDSKTLAHLFKYDSVHRTFDGEVSYNDKGIVINGKTILVYSEKDPKNLPWGELSVDVVLECTGIFRTKEKAEQHVTAGAKKVIISAPAKGENVKQVVLGINEDILDGTETVISNASCTTNCATPMVKVLDELCGIEKAFLTTIHSFTGDQRIHDAPHSDLRRARAASVSLVPTSTGAAEAVTQIIPEMEGRLIGSAIRVPVPDGSITELTCNISREVTIEEINNAFKNASEKEFKGIIQFITDPIVSCDIVGNTHSTIFDSELTSVNGKMIKISAWYDNEMGYSTRLAELVEVVMK